MLVLIKKFLPFAVNKLGIKNKMDAYEIFQLWNKIIGVKYPNKTKPLSFKKEVLIIGCQNSVLVAELRLREKKVLREINQKTKLVQKIKFTMV